LKNFRSFLSIISLSFILILAACGGNDEENNSDNTNLEETEEESHSDMDMENNTEDDSDTEHADMEDQSGSHEGMNHSSSGEVPEDLQMVEDPTFEVGSKAIITSDHMEGMDGAEATIVGAYDTTVYTVSYIPTTGGEKVENHKWVIHEELTNAGEKPFKTGDEVTINASHMEGMNGATAVIDSAEQTTVYMVDFTSTTSGEEVKNHKWVTEGELAPVE
jgi:hypothetical protein